MTQAKEADWYNEHYKVVQTAWPPWYRFLLPDLNRVLAPQNRLVELGCGQGMLLRHLHETGFLPEENIYGIDQSSTAVDFVRGCLPKAHVSVGDIYRLEFPPNHFQVCLLMETIEHLEDPAPALQQIHSVVAPEGRLYVSFPNFLSLPWLPVRILSEKLNKPNWVVLQPIDKIYTVFHVIRIAEAAGFRFERGIGSGYGPPILYRWEKDWMTHTLNALRLWRFSFHPILVFRKPAQASGSDVASA
jgi:2-polyprenyl-3-methyl-5-hydroxy-6-metoxy-1,4-benzoquinol methylase